MVDKVFGQTMIQIWLKVEWIKRMYVDVLPILSSHVEIVCLLTCDNTSEQLYM